MDPVPEPEPACIRQSVLKRALTGPEKLIRKHFPQIIRSPALAFFKLGTQIHALAVATDNQIYIASRPESPAPAGIIAGTTRPEYPPNSRMTSSSLILAASAGLPFITDSHDYATFAVQLVFGQIAWR